MSRVGRLGLRRTRKPAAQDAVPDWGAHEAVPPTQDPCYRAAQDAASQNAVQGPVQDAAPEASAPPTAVEDNPFAPPPEDAHDRQRPVPPSPWGAPPRQP